MEDFTREALFWGDSPEYVVYFAIFISIAGSYLLNKINLTSTKKRK